METQTVKKEDELVQTSTPGDHLIIKVKNIRNRDLKDTWKNLNDEIKYILKIVNINNNRHKEHRETLRNFTNKI